MSMSSEKEDDEVYDNFDPAKDAYEPGESFIPGQRRSADQETGSASVLVTRFQRFRHHVKHVLNSHYFHVLVIVLIVVDCLCVLGEIVIDYVDVTLAKHGRQAHNTTHALQTTKMISALIDSSESIVHRDSTEYIYADHGDDNHTISHERVAAHHAGHPKLHHALEVTEDVLKFISLAILGLFIIEIVLKMLFTPGKFFKSKLEIMDAVVIVVSFVVSLLVINIKHVIHSFGALLIVIR